MSATLMYGAGDVRVEEVPDAAIKEPTDAAVRVVLSCVCGSDNTCDVYCTGHHVALTAGVNARTTVTVVRDGGAVGRVGAARYTAVPMDFGTVMRNITLTGGVAPARAYIEGYRAMARREALKVLVRP